MPVSEALRAVLAEAQRIGAIGPSSLARAMEHAMQFVACVPVGPIRLIDLGSGGGLPGLVIADQRPECVVTLVDRRQSRVDQLTRAIRSLGWGDRVTALCDDMATVAASRPKEFDVATGRGFGPPALTLEYAIACVRNGGTIVISEPPDDRPDRWPHPLPDRIAESERRGAVRVFHVKL
ncbi:MAG: class I SAM-dependent methyltransferase [Actinomycetales bacterium]|nr:class I SAM-dependent methyltransferase [Actinomycetales bacterium]